MFASIARVAIDRLTGFGRMINVGVDATNFTPIFVDTVADMIAAGPEYDLVQTSWPLNDAERS